MSKNHKKTWQHWKQYTIMFYMEVVVSFRKTSQSSQQQCRRTLLRRRRVASFVITFQLSGHKSCGLMTALLMSLKMWEKILKQVEYESARRKRHINEKTRNRDEEGSTFFYVHLSRELKGTQGYSREPKRIHGNSWELKGPKGTSRELKRTQ